MSLSSCLSRSFSACFASAWAYLVFSLCSASFTAGTSITREIYFVWDNGWWKHHLTEEEKEIFMPGVP